MSWKLRLQERVWGLAPWDARRDGLERHARWYARHAQLLACNARQLGVFAANVYAVDGGGAMSQHQRQIGNAITAAKIEQARRGQVEHAAHPVVHHIGRVLKMRTKPFVGDTPGIPRGQAPHALLQTQLPAHCGTA